MSRGSEGISMMAKFFDKHVNDLEEPTYNKSMMTMMKFMPWGRTVLFSGLRRRLRRLLPSP